MKAHAAAAFTLLILFSCATYQSKVESSRQLLRHGQVTEAAEKLKPLAENPGDDQLVYLLDYATALQAAGEYKESIKSFAQADKLIDFNDYHSVSRIALATLSSEDQVQYKGESYEKILLNAFQALNYLMIHEFDDALVEVRRVNEKIEKIRLDGRKDYELNPFASYLGGLIWEAAGKNDDAYISYNDSYKLDSSNPYLPEDLIRSARKSHRMDEYQKWKKQFPHVVENPDWYDRKKGELVVVIEQGWGPEKRFQADNRFARLVAVGSQTHYAKATIDGVGTFNSRVVYDVEKVAIKTFNDDQAWAIARKVSGVAAKAVVADQIRQKNEALGFLSAIAMRVADHADLRQWSTLPKSVQLVHLWLPEGKYQLSLQGESGAEIPTADHYGPVSFTVKNGNTAFVSWRSLR